MLADGSGFFHGKTNQPPMTPATPIAPQERICQRTLFGVFRVFGGFTGPGFLTESMTHSEE